MSNLISIQENELAIQDFDEDSVRAILREPIIFEVSFGKVETKDIWFYKNSTNPVEIGLDYPIKINTVIGTVQIWDYVQFHKNGNISEMRLWKPRSVTTPFGNILIKDRVRLYPNGAIKNVVSCGDNDLNFCSGFRDGDVIHFLPDGSLHIGSNMENHI